ncbi:WXG100 family type VII secretion target [Streptomyces aureus]
MADSWVGGDIGGLRTMAETYRNAKKALEGVVHPLGGAVDSLVDDAGWKGEAAESFRAAWSEDALTAGAFAGLVHDAGDILGTLVDALSACDTALKNAEHIATHKGVPMGDKGVPQAFVTADPPSADDQKTISAATEYDTVRKEVLHTAQHARLVAADRLRGLYAQATAKVSPATRSPSPTICAACTPTTQRTRGPAARRPGRGSTTPSPRRTPPRRHSARNGRRSSSRAAGCPTTSLPRAPIATPSRTSSRWSRTSPAPITAAPRCPTTAP